ncbi:MAG TPA: amidase domain-containing protein [Anaerolineaceae bacterium]|nr:amidase domain-containing protein [Anaerolineaceae bacterium]
MPNITNILFDYSQLLSSGKTIYSSFYSPQIIALANERRGYYGEFFEKGLHANLLTVNSKFITNTNVEVNLIGSEYKLNLDEVVILSGKPIITQPEKFPLIIAAKWALANTNNDIVKNELFDYISSMTDGVNMSVQEGVTTSLTIHHELFLLMGGLQIVQDTFNDKNSDNPNGFDNVSWNNGVAIRQKPDLTKMPDYIINNTAVETLGQSLLLDFTNSISEVLPNTTGFTYSHSAASSYAQQYSSEATTACTGTTDIWKNTAYYNSAYSSVWGSTGCDDCADFVSQALVRGGFPTDATWYPSIASYDWINTFHLRDYLVGLGAITSYSVNQSSLQVGDIALTTDDSHIVMVTHINPYYYSGHTRDRKNHAWDPSLTDYRHILTNVP